MHFLDTLLYWTSYDEGGCSYTDIFARDFASLNVLPVQVLPVIQNRPPYPIYMIFAPHNVFTSQQNQSISNPGYQAAYPRLKNGKGLLLILWLMFVNLYFRANGTMYEDYFMEQHSKLKPF